MTVTTISDALATIRARIEVCECGDPAGADPLRCTDCGRALCPECAGPLGALVVAGVPLACCDECAIRDVRDNPPTAAEAAAAMAAVAADQRRLMEMIGLREVPAA